MKRAISYVALCCLISFEAAHSASVEDSDGRIVKRDADIFPAIMGGAVDMTLDLLDRFGKGFAIRGNSETDAVGLHDEKNFEMGLGEAMTPQERKKRSPVPCGTKNETSASGTGSNVNRRNATSNPDVELLARRKRSAQSSNPANPPPNGPPPNGPSPNGPAANGCGPPPNGNGTRPGNNAAVQNRAQSSDQVEASSETPLIREKRSPCNNATALRSKRSPQRPNNNDGVPPMPQQHDGRQHQERNNENRNDIDPRQGQNKNTNYRVRRSAKPCNGQNGNGQPIGVPTNNVPQSPQQQQQQQQQPPGGVNIEDLQRDQNQRTRRDVNDPDKVLPGTSNNEDKNLFERIVQVAKEVVARVTRWVQEMDKEQSMTTAKNPSENPKQ